MWRRPGILAAVVLHHLGQRAQPFACRRQQPVRLVQLGLLAHQRVVQLAQGLFLKIDGLFQPGQPVFQFLGHGASVG